MVPRISSPEVLAMRLRFVLLASCLAIGCGSSNPGGDDTSNVPDANANAPEDRKSVV